MKIHVTKLVVSALCLFATIGVFAQGTAFTYQGRLNTGGIPANGNYDFTFTLWSANSGGSEIGGALTNAGVGVANGLFTVTLDFGQGIYTGQSCWLQVNVETNGVGPYVALTPLQPLTPTPYAVYAESAGIGGVGNTATGYEATVSGGGDNTASEFYSTVGGGLQNTASGIDSVVPGGVDNVAGGNWSFAAGSQAIANNNGAFVWADNSAGSFASTANNQFSVRAQGGVRFVTGGAGLTGLTLDGYQVLTTASGGGGGGGGSTNGWLLTGNVGANPANGYFVGTLDSFPLELHVNGQRGLRLEYSGTYDQPNVIGGSSYNSVASGMAGSTIGGGIANTNGGNYGTIGGGAFNLTGATSDATVAGGLKNSATGYGAAVGGGNGNTAGGADATVPGGSDNSANGEGSFAAGQNAHAGYNGSFVWGDGSGGAYDNAPNEFQVLATGGVGLYTGTNDVNIVSSGALTFGSSTRQMIDLYNAGIYDYGIGVQTATLYERAGTGGGFAWYSGGVPRGDQDDNGGGTTLMTLDGSGDLNVTANASVCTLAIRGGCDVAEPFVMSTSVIVKGSVVVIDEEHAGQLKLSDQPYDTRVAGIVSGANGINPGIALHQDGVFEEGQNVALSGRVYVQADAAYGAIKPGDLLTTSATPGHAMRVADHAKAQGAILGKAMSGLKDGQGMVLVLVSLQ
jgi:hypothetical protein